jgi:hypothetical protein
MNEPTAPRRYGDEEIARILKRATEIQIADPALTASSGMTLAELESVALEAGIDVRHIRRAAMELEVGAADDESTLSKLAGGPLVIELGTVLPGELSAVGFERVLSVIQQAARHHGQGSMLGHTLTWQGETSNSQRSLMVVVSSRDGETSVRIEERLHGFGGALFGGMMGGGGGFGISAGVGIGATLGSALVAVSFSAGAVGLLYLGARAIYRNRAQARRRILTTILDRIAGEAAAAVQDAPVAELPTPARPTAIPGR